MAKSLYLKTLGPVISVNVNVKDINGVGFTSTVGLKRPTKEQSAEILKEISESPAVKTFEETLGSFIDLVGKEKSAKESFISGQITEQEYDTLLGELTPQLHEINQTFKEQKEAQQAYLYELVRDKIVYFQNVVFEEYEDDKLVNKFTVTDTRSPQEMQDYWRSAEECRDIALTQYEASDAWKQELTSLYAKLLNNQKLYQEESQKN